MQGSKKILGTKFQKIYSIGLFLMLGVLVFLLFPKQSHFAYDFKKGSPWLGENLIAPFDFAISKTPEEIKAERDSIKASFIPYYVIDNTVDDTVIGQFVNALDEFFPNQNDSHNIQETDENQFFVNRLPGNFRDALTQLLVTSVNSIYRKGVIPASDSLSDFPNASINLVEGNINKGLQNRSEFYTPDEALSVLKNELISKLQLQFHSGDSLIPYLVEEVFSVNFFKPNIVADVRTTYELLKQKYANLAGAEGAVQKGELIVLKGNIVDNQTYRTLISLQNEYSINSENNGLGKVQFGLSLLVFIILLIYYLHLFFNFKTVLFNPKQITFIIVQMGLMVVLTYLIIQVWDMNIYVIPYVIVPILIYTFFNNRIALVSFWMLMLLIGFFAPNSFEFVFIQITAGMVVLFSLRHIQRRFHLFVSVLLVLVSYVVAYSGFTIINGIGFSEINWETYAWFGGNAFFLLTLFPLMYLYERIFGFISDVTLLELSDTNNPALRTLFEKAPGTFQHSMQVANLAESVIRKIGGSALLVRTGALYHDIGKTEIPEYFIENQHGVNIHDNLTFDESASIIINHVNKGLELAKKYRIPSTIVSFIATHHGTTMTKYFYNSYINQHNAINIDPAKFTYPGPKPETIENAVIMMADAVEASSRSLKSYTRETIAALVNKIIDGQVAEGQFEKVNLTFRNISETKEIFIEKLMNIYHTRIEYPEINKA
ncbi:MAG TPA: HDIG domain-containing protein [Bacteroidales bacterium]|nr:HDIG domain-containing protein [Bacteroidales bacterium]